MNNQALPFVAVDSNDEAVGYMFCQIKSVSEKGPFSKTKACISTICVLLVRRGESIGNAP